MCEPSRQLNSCSMNKEVGIIFIYSNVVTWAPKARLQASWVDLQPYFYAAKLGVGKAKNEPVNLGLPCTSAALFKSTLGTRAIKTAGFAVCNIFWPVKLGDWAQIIFSVRCRDQSFFTKPNDDVVRLIVDLAPILHSTG